MIHLLLAVIYLSFISLGLPDSLLGAAWPSMYGEFGTPVSYAGVVALLVAVDWLHYHRRYVLDLMKDWHWTVRTCLYAGLLMSVVIFGVFGVNYDEGTFIYFAF